MPTEDAESGALHAHVESLDGMGCPTGWDPRRMSVAELEAAGHHADLLLRLIAWDRRVCGTYRMRARRFLAELRAVMEGSASWSLRKRNARPQRGRLA